MTGKKWIVLGIVLAAVALLGLTTAQAGPPAQQPEPRGSGEAHIAPQRVPGEPGRAAPAMALGSAFTYQGQLKQGDEPVTGDCEMAFRLYDQATDGTQVGSAITTTVPISRMESPNRAISPWDSSSLITPTSLITREIVTPMMCLS